MTYRIIGIESSPYSVKVRAVMRYRHLPYRWVSRMPQFFDETRAVKPLLMPVVQYPDGSYHVDSTPIVLDLEARHPAARSVLPEDPAAAFACLLVEDLADEWLTKSLFHYRFAFDAGRRYGSTWVMDDAHPDTDAGELRERAEAFLARQLERMPLVGCVPGNTTVLEAAYERVLDALEPFVANGRFLFGSRPSLADFALFGQLRTLATDPVPMALMRERAPRTEHWVRRLDDTSGVDGEWDARPSLVDGPLAPLFALAGAAYLPYLGANAQALARGEQTVSVILGGQTYTQPVFRYHAKCLAFLRERYAALDAAARARLEPLLTDSGCAAVLAE